MDIISQLFKEQIIFSLLLFHYCIIIRLGHQEEYIFIFFILLFIEELLG